MDQKPRQLRHKNVAVPGPSTELFGPSASRVAVFVSADPVQYICVTFGVPSGDHTGFQIIPFGQGLWLTKEMIGDAITGPINAFANGATTVACVSVHEG